MGRLTRMVWCPVFAAAAVLLGSCGSDGPKLHPVSGKVLFEGNPVEGASVVFVPASGGDLKPSGRTGKDGSFTLSTYPHGDGAPAGDYTVVVTWYPDNARELDNPKNKLPDKYAHPDKPLLRATVRDEATDLEPFRLTK
jgi:hypothetical protein